MNANIYTTLSLVLSITMICVSSLAQQSIEPLLDQLNDGLEDARTHGAMITIVSSDSIYFAGGIGYADYEKRQLVTADHLFRMGSISKSITALGIMRLVEDGTVSLETNLKDIDPKLPIINPWNKTHPVKVKHLLEHTAGFDDLHIYAWHNTKDESTPSTASMVSDIQKSLHIRWPPGSHFSYSNPGYIVAGHIIETLTGQPYSQYLHQVLQNIEMNTSGFYYDIPPADIDMAQGYHNEGGQFSPIPFRKVYAGASGDFCSSGADMARFIQLMLNKGKHREKQIYSPSTIDRIERQETSLAARHGMTNGYGLANQITWKNGHIFYGHDGGIPGFSSEYLYSRSADLGIAVSVNANGFPQHLIDIIRN